jgi:hypothetical protein
LHIQIHEESLFSGLPTQFQREVAGKGSRADASFGAYNSNHFGWIRQPRRSVRGNRADVPHQGILDGFCQGVTSANTFKEVVLRAFLD